MHSVILTEFSLQTIYLMEFSKQICFMICKNLSMRGFVTISRNVSIESGCDAGSHKLVDHNGTSTIVNFELFFLRLMAKMHPCRKFLGPVIKSGTEAIHIQ